MVTNVANWNWIAAPALLVLLALAGCTNGPAPPAFCMDPFDENDCIDYCDPRFYWFEMHDTQSVECGAETCDPGVYCCYCVTDDNGNPA